MIKLRLRVAVMNIRVTINWARHKMVKLDSTLLICRWGYISLWFDG